MSIKEEIHALSDEMITNLGRLVAIDSQLGTPAEGMPFGEGPAKALSEGLKIAQELGFHTVNLDNYCGYAEMGEGEEIVGIAGHLDIVPVGGDWTHDPFKLTREGDYVYGRGTTDDKGPVLEALYAMKLLRDSGVKLNKRVRLIMGCNEETGSKCMEHYNEVAEELSCGFTPDANFPCIHGEKGHMSMMAYSKNTKIISMNGGFVSNAICDTCTTVIPASAGMKDKLEEALSQTGLKEYKVTERNGQISIYAKGIPAHASTPTLGVNAAGVTFECLEKAGFENVTVVPEQELPDSEFTTVGYPNPENPAVFELAIKLAEKIDADIILGTDPDCDRVGAVVKTKDGSYTVLTGNMTGTLICNYICSQKAKLGTLPKNGALVSTIVSSEMTKAIAKKYNLAYFDVLTGFKYIGEKIKEFEQTGDYQYVFGFEESYGCLSGTYASDKDAVVASLLICEMAAYYKSRGMSLYDGLMELYDTYGVYKEIIHSITLKGIEGIENMKKIMDTLRKDAPSEIAGVKVTETRDYLEDKIVDVATGKVSPTNLPKSNVLYFTLADDTWFCVRPSGTEPKIKIYFGTKADTVENAEKKIATAQDGIMKVVNSVLGE